MKKELLFEAAAKEFHQSFSNPQNCEKEHSAKINNNNSNSCHNDDDNDDDDDSRNNNNILLKA